MTHVMKVEFEGILRRLPYNIQGTEDLSFAKLEARVRELFKLPSEAQLKMTYNDKEDDVVTLTNDHELQDACVTQELSPLRLQVFIVAPKTAESELPAAGSGPADLPSAQTPESAKKPTISEAGVKKIVECYAPLFQGICPPGQIPDLLDVIVKRVGAQLSTVTVQTNETVPPSAERSRLTPQDWLRSLPTSKVSSEVKKQDEARVETGAGTVAASAETTNEVIHRGVTCDICHMSPITGIRFKAIKKHDYDLCGRCFDKSGNPDEYNRIEQPLSRPAWGSIPVRMVRLTPATAIGLTDSSLTSKLVLAPNGRRCKSTRRS
ncbi:hypothetical protein Mapa_015632 [Marchantia paleacea]|nr:hypothetical protein Mapa_015632 [Marchantia paleacea]